MILQELHRYYERLLADPDRGVPPEHWSTEKVAWEITIAKDGRVVRIVPLTAGEGKSIRRFISMRVPEHGARSGTGILPFFLCDNAAYLLGLDEKHGAEKRAGSRELHDDILAECDDVGARAVCAFFEREDSLDNVDEECKNDLTTGGGFAVFRLEGDRQRIHEREAICDAWMSHCSVPSEDAMLGQCAITGQNAPIARLFPQVTGVPGAQSAGASLVSFNLDSFESYGKKQGYNASLSEKVAFNAGSALRSLFADPRHRVRFGQTTVVFWTDRPAPAEEDMMLAILGDEPDLRAESNIDLEHIQKTLNLMRTGLPLSGYDLETRFFILGIAPNAARLAVRFFETDTFGSIAQHYGQYLRDIEMVGVKPRSLRTMLRQTAPQGDADSVPATLINSCLNAMLTGSRFPQALPELLIMRLRADHGEKNSWDMGQRAALLKACLVRSQRLAMRKGNSTIDDERGLHVALNKENPNKGYVLGRLFAIMERAQKVAVGDVNISIRGRYVGAASSTPVRVFQPLLLNYEHHMEKIRRDKPGLGVYLEREFNQAMGMLEAYGDEIIPSTLSMNDQINFFVGCHQEAENLWKSDKEDDEKSVGDFAE